MVIWHVAPRGLAPAYVYWRDMSRLSFIDINSADAIVREWREPVERQSILATDTAGDITVGGVVAATVTTTVSATHQHVAAKVQVSAVARPEITTVDSTLEAEEPTGQQRR